jgi:MFS family permease
VKWPSAVEWRSYGVTGGTFGASSAQTLLVALLPVMLREHAPSSFYIGLVIASEGLASIVAPYPAGAISDALSSRFSQIRSRTVPLLVFAPLVAISIAIIPFLDGFLPLAFAAIFFFMALHAYRTPMWALLPDAVPHDQWGRVEGVRGALHSAGLGFGLVGGGLLYGAWPPLPFLLAAALVIATTAVTVFAARGNEGAVDRASRDGQSASSAPGDADGTDDDEPSGDDDEPSGDDDEPPGDDDEPPGDDKEPPGDDDEPSGDDDGATAGGDQHVADISLLWHALRDKPAVRWFLGGHTLWTAAVDGIRPYIFLFTAAVLGISVSESSLLLSVLLVGLALGSILIGRLGDRVGRGRLLMWCAFGVGIAMSAGVFVRSVPVALAVLVPVGIGAAGLVALPYPLYVSLVGQRDAGRFTAMYYWAVGLAQIIAPILVGFVIDVGQPLFPEQEGYPLMWPVVGLMAMLGGASLLRARRLTPADEPPR